MTLTFSVLKPAIFDMFSSKDPACEYQPEHVYTFQTPGLLIGGDPVNSFVYKPAHAYSVETFEAINDWLKTNSLEIDGEPINHFEYDSEGRLIAMTQTPIEKEAAVAEIVRQLGNWNVYTAQNGVVTSSQGGFLLGQGTIRAPDVAFTPQATYSTLTPQQRLSFKRASFSPVFAVEVDDLTNQHKLDSLTKKIKETYFPSGIRLAWLVDATHQIFFTFSSTTAGVVRCYSCKWLNEDGKPAVVRGGDVLPGFLLELSLIDNAISPVCFQNLMTSYLIYCSEANILSSGNRFTCPKCDKIFVLKYNFMQHFEKNH